MGLIQKWSCDRCGKRKFVRVKYDWSAGLGDVWHPSWLHGFDKGLFCGACLVVISDRWHKRNPNAVLTA